MYPEAAFCDSPLTKKERKKKGRAKSLEQSRLLDLDRGSILDNAKCLISVIKQASPKHFPRAAIHNNEWVPHYLQN